MPHPEPGGVDFSALLIICIASWLSGPMEQATYFARKSSPEIY
jgi:hypothetical protein